MEKQELPEHFWSSNVATIHCAFKSAHGNFGRLLLDHIRMGGGNQHNAVHLPGPSVQFRSETDR